MVAQIDLHMLRTRPTSAIGRLFNYAFVEGRPVTTKGQWINPLVFAGFKAVQRLPQLRPIKSPIFIVGNGRSGTTLLGRLFALHQDVSFLNEPKALWHFAHGSEDIIGSYSEAPACVRLVSSRDLDATCAKIKRIYGLSLRISGAQRIVDKYPELVFRTDFVQNLFPDAKFVCPLRDGVDVVNSVAQWSTKKAMNIDGKTHNWWGKNDRKWELLVDQIVPEHKDLAHHQAKLRETNTEVDRAAVEWILTTRETLQLQANTNVPLQIIQFEELCANPTTILEQLFSWLDLSNDKLVLDFAQSHTRSAPTHGDVKLLPELVAPFRNTLDAAGYRESASRVLFRI